MSNPIPAPVRLWLYLAGSVASLTAGSGILDNGQIRVVAFVAAVLGLLAAANVNLPAKPE